MLFNTMQYLVFLPIVVLVYFILPQKIRYVWLLIASYYFYMQWNPLYVVLLFSCTFITYTGGRMIGKLKTMEIVSIQDSYRNAWGGGIKESSIYVLPYVFY